MGRRLLLHWRLWSFLDFWGRRRICRLHGLRLGLRDGGGSRLGFRLRTRRFDRRLRFRLRLGRLCPGVQGGGLCVQGGGGHNGRGNDGIVHRIALHVAHQRLPHGLRALPPVLGAESGCLQNDGRHFVVCIGGGRQGFPLQAASLRPFLRLRKGTLPTIVYQIKDHAQGVEINGGIHLSKIVKQLRRGKGPPVFGGEGGVR